MILFIKDEREKKMAVLDIKIDDLDDILNKNEKVFVDVWATWCMSCKVMSPIFEDISDKYSNILFVRIEADGDNVVGEKLDVKSIPSFLVFKEGALIDKKTGMMTVDDLEEMVSSYALLSTKV